MEQEKIGQELIEYVMEWSLWHEAWIFSKKVLEKN